MPIYEYQCQSCGAVVEQWQRMSDPAPEKCESCGGSMSKLMSHSSFHLKGSGWYVTDYAGNKSKNKVDSGKSGVSEEKKTEKKSSVKQKKSAS